MVILLSRVSKFQIFVVFFFFWLLLLLFVSFSTLTMSCHSFLVFIVSAEKSTDSLMGISFVALCFSLSAFRKLFLSLTFAVLIIICLDVLFGFILFGILWPGPLPSLSLKKWKDSGAYASLYLKYCYRGPRILLNLHHRPQSLIKLSILLRCHPFGLLMTIYFGTSCTSHWQYQ